MATNIYGRASLAP